MTPTSSLEGDLSARLNQVIIVLFYPLGSNPFFPFYYLLTVPALPVYRTVRVADSLLTWVYNGPGRASQRVSWSRCSPHRYFFSSSIHSLGGYHHVRSVFLYICFWNWSLNWPFLLYSGGYLFPLLRHSDREEIPPHLQPCCLLSQVQWTCSTSCCQVGYILKVTDGNSRIQIRIH
jgi:hypothetical protein